MNMTTKPGSHARLLLAMILAGGALAAGEARAGCSAGDDTWVPMSNVYFDDGFKAGDEVKGSTGNTIHYKVNCDPSERVDITLVSRAPYYGEVEGVPTFSTSDRDIGLQIEYRHPTVSGGMSDWKRLDDMGGVAAGVAIPNAADGTWHFPVQYDFRYVAINDFTGNGTVNGQGLAIANSRSHSGLSLPEPDVEGFGVTRRLYSYCNFSSTPPSTVTVPTTAPSTLAREGDTGRASEFSFGWYCVDGNDGDYAGGGDFRFKYTKASSGKTGHIQSTGTAKGADLLVSMTDPGTKEEKPIEHEVWYSKGKPLPYTGRRDLQVRFVRNGEATLVPGDVQGTLTIEVLKY
ncbi:hypothetical protein [Stenotrophomonas maltophilia]|uniref:hypothetical protein n=1 Tax=Stenotrophomonas maltophilia TaxID=40324 RepID=UPI000ABEF4A8|nr:hypothetical protein [Stenotrophomonas maltophilia]